MEDKIEKIEALNHWEAGEKTKAQLIDELWSATYALQQIQEGVDEERERHDKGVADGREILLAGAVAFEMLESDVARHLRIYTRRHLRKGEAA